MVLAGIATFQFATRQSSGNQSLTVPIGGMTPLAVVIEGSGASGAPDTIANHARAFFGFADGTNEFSFSVRDEDNVSPTDSGKRAFASILELIATGTNASAGTASFVSFGTNNVTINWSVGAAAGFGMNVTVFFGDEMEVSLEEHIHSAAANVESSIASLSFQPNLLMCWSAQVNGAFPTPAFSLNHWMCHHGIAIEQFGVITQGCYASRSRDNLSFQAGCAPLLRDNAISAHLVIDTTGDITETGFLVLDSFNSDGITVSPSAASMRFNVVYVLARIPSNRMALSFQSLNTDTTGTGSAKKITTGWMPNSGRFIGTNVPL